MRRLITSGAVFAAAGAVALAATAGGSAATTHSRAKKAPNYGTKVMGTLPTAGKPKNGGDITIGQITGQTPTYIMPIIPGANSSTGTFAFIQQLYTPLYYGPTGATPTINYSLSAATGPPKPSNGDKTYTIHLKPSMKWSDGQPVDSQDVAFSVALLKAAVAASSANWGQYTPGQFPMDVTGVQTPNATTIVLNLNRAYNPGYFLNNQLQDTNGGLYPLPHTAWNVSSAGGAHITDWATNTSDATAIYNYLNTAGQSVSTFGTNPLWQDVDGPFKLKDFNATTSSYDLVPNPSYGLSPKARAEISVETYTSSTAELNAERSGSLDIGGLDIATQRGAIPGLKSQGSSVYGGPSWGWFGGIINFADTTAHWNKVISQQYMRQVFAELINQPAILKGVYHNWAVPAYGPVPTAPFSPYTPKDAANGPFKYNPAKAVTTLKAHGWRVKPGGTTTCVKPGKGAHDCGAGIPKGNPISVVWANVPESTAAAGFLESESIASTAKKYAGIKISLISKTFNFLVSNFNLQNPAAKKYKNDWGVNNYGGLFEDYYPTQEGVENPGAGFNMGLFDDPIGNALMRHSVFSTNPNAIKAEASYLTRHYPVFYLPDNDAISVVNKAVGGSANAFLMLTQQTFAGNLFYLKK